MRFIAGDPATVSVRWYWCFPDAKFMKIPTAFGSAVYEDRNYPIPDRPLGEVFTWHPEFIDGYTPPRGPGQCRVGTDAQYLQGFTPEDLSHPPAVPLCCYGIASEIRETSSVSATAAMNAVAAQLGIGMGLASVQVGFNPFACLIWWFRPEDWTDPVGTLFPRWPPATAAVPAGTALGYLDWLDHTQGTATLIAGPAVRLNHVITGHSPLTLTSSYFTIFVGLPFRDFTQLVVARVFAPPRQSGFFVEDRNTPATNRWLEVQPSGQSAQVEGTTATGPADPNQGSTGLWEIRRDGAAFLLSENASPVSAGATTATGSYAGAETHLNYYGPTDADTAYLGNVIFYELIGFNCALDAKTEAYWRSYLAGKYGITLADPDHFTVIGILGSGARLAAQIAGSYAITGTLGSGHAPASQTPGGYALVGALGHGAAPASTVAAGYALVGAIGQGSAPASTQAGSAPALFTIGLNFRGTAGYVTNGTNDATVLGELFPHTYLAADGKTIVAGFDNTAEKVDRFTTGDARLAGFNSPNVSGEKFRITLPSTGPWSIRLAAGDHLSGGVIVWTLSEPGGGPFATISGSPTTANYLDASGVSRTEAAWPGSNVAISHTFTGTELVLQKQNAAGTRNQICHLKLTKL